MFVFVCLFVCSCVNVRQKDKRNTIDKFRLKAKCPVPSEVKNFHRQTGYLAEFGKWMTNAEIRVFPFRQKCGETELTSLCSYIPLCIVYY